MTSRKLSQEEVEALNFRAAHPGVEKWRVVEPGLIELPGTKYRIRYTGECQFRLTWGDKAISVHPVLWLALNSAARHAQEMIHMGLADG